MQQHVQSMKKDYNTNQLEMSTVTTSVNFNPFVYYVSQQTVYIRRQNSSVDDEMAT